MKNLLALVLAISLFPACNSANNQHPTVQYEDKKESLKEIESGSPLKFLKVKGDFRNNLLRQTVVEGQITNNASFVAYKNMQLQIIFRDKEGTTILKMKQVLNDEVKAGDVDNFMIKLNHVKDAYTVSLDIMGADVD